MLTASQRAQWRSARDTLDGHLISTLDRIMATAHGAPGKETKDLILTAIPEVVKAHGTVTAELTAEFYALARTNASLNDLFTPEPVWDPNEQQIAGSLRWALRPINGEQYTGEDYARAVDRVRAAMTRLMRQTEGTTVMENVRRDPRRPLYRRVPEAGACGWCMMLATRGHVYTKDTVGGPHKRYHDRCKCSSEPQYPGEELPPLVQAARKAYYDFYYPDDSGNPSPEGLQQFFNFVQDGGLGDRPRPGRDSKGRYRLTVDGQEVPFTFDDIPLSRSRLWKHISTIGGGRGGHLVDHAAHWAQDSDWLNVPKTIFPAGYTREDFSRHLGAVMRDPTSIFGDVGGAFFFRREVEGGLTVEAIVGRAGDGSWRIRSFYPVAGDGALTVRPKSQRATPLPTAIPRVRHSE
ncbi:hypothetical protein [Brevibacterium otitidis]|uniref:Uncharacterized protein n=1 Tax=Brevibacterium otitidis TaxID=53364 RepID=A0ABV5X2C9_9MICO|nr:hypothetical protein GCM10023233_22750 [Brevibacterium otitidis]